MIKQVSEYAGMPPWVRSFFKHVVKRCCGIIVKWIDDATSEPECERIASNGHNRY